MCVFQVLSMMIGAGTEQGQIQRSVCSETRAVNLIKLSQSLAVQGRIRCRGGARGFNCCYRPESIVGSVHKSYSLLACNCVQRC